MSNGPELTIFTPFPAAVFAQPPLLLLNQCRSLAWARLSSQFLRKLKRGIMNHISRRAAAGTNADAGLVHHRERSMTLHHSPWNQGGAVLHDDCRRRMQAFKQ